MAFVKPVSVVPTARLIGSGANLLRFKTYHVLMTHSVYNSHEREAERWRGNE